MSSRFSHWSLRYLCDRLKLTAYQIVHPDAPWLTPHAVAFLNDWLRPEHTGLEWGAGRSTMWFAARVDRLISIEHDAVWYARVQGKLLSRPRNNVNLILTGPDADEYLRPALELEDNSLDFALVDGISTLRDRCAESVIPKIRPGGLLILDDVHRYLPSDSRAPRALPIEAEPSSACWVRVADAVAGWDLIETSSGVTDTDLMRRPE